MADQKDSGDFGNHDAPFDIRVLLVRFRRRLPVFLAIAALVMAMVTAYTLTRKPIYTATANVLVEPRQMDVLKSQTVTTADSNTVDTAVQVFTSRSLITRVVLRLHLYEDPEFNPSLVKPSQAALDSLAAPAARISLGSDPNQTAPSNSLVTDPALEAIIDGVQWRTAVRRAGLTYVINVSFTSSQAAKAARIANAVAEQYLIDQAEAKFSVARGNGDWLSSRLDSLRQEVEQADAAVQRFKIANNLLSSDGATMAEQEVSTLNQQIAAARADLSEKQARLQAAQDQVRRGGGGGDVTAALGSDVVRDLRKQRAEVSRRKAELETRYGPLYPDVNKTNRELADIDATIAQEISRILSNLSSEVQIARQRTNSLEGSRGNAKGSLASNNSAMVGLMELQRKADASRGVYEAFLARSKESAAQEGIQTADTRIASLAQPPNAPSSPNVKLNLALGLVLAVLAGLSVVVFLETLDSGLRTSTDVETLLRVPSIGAIPIIPGRNKRIENVDYVIEKPFSVFAESFRSLKASLMFSRNDRQVQIIAISSSLPGEGKTLTSMALGRSIAASGASVIILDGDLRRRMLTKSLDITAETGLIEVLEGKAKLEDVWLVDDVSGAIFLPVGETLTPTTDIINGPALTTLFDDLRNRFQFILIDTAPVMAVADTRIIASKADAVVFLVQWSKTPRQAALASLDLLLNAGAFIAGVCLTQVDLNKQSKHGYGDKLYYYNSYSKYYSE